MGNLVFQATLGGQVNLVGPNTASTYNLNVPAVAGTLVTTGDTATVTNTMISGPVSIAKGGTNQTAYTSPAASVNGLVWFDGTSFQNDTSPAHVGYNSSTNTFNALNILSPNDASISGLTVGKGAGSVSTNTAVGASALAANTTGTTSTAVGGGALATQTTANYNTAFGYNALNLNNGDENTAVGVTPLALNTTGTNNNAFGNNTLGANTTGSYNTAFGKNALRFNTTASNNTAVGYQAGYSNTTGAYNCYIGYTSGYTNSTSQENTGLGNQTLYYNTGANNSAVGSAALYNNSSGANNTAIGQKALFSNTTASNNTAVGYQTGYGNTTGVSNAFFGRQAGYSCTTGSYNTFVGAFNSSDTPCGGFITTGSKNTILGGYSGNQGGLDIRTASNYIVLSDGDGNPRGIFDNAYTTAMNSPSGQTYVQLDWRINNVLKSAIWWNDTTTRLQTYTNANGPYLTQGGTSWTNSSDERLKNITGEIQNGLDKVCSLRAAKYTWKSDVAAKPQVGLIAQDVLAVLPEAVDVPVEGAVEKDGSEVMLGVNYDHVIPLLVAAIKELKADLDATKAELQALKGQA